MKSIRGNFLKKYHSPHIFWWEWMLVGLISLFVLLSLNYIDLGSLTIWSTNFWDVLWEGRLQEFYTHTALNLHNITHPLMGCDIFAILPLSIWNFPIWVAQYFFGKNIAENVYLLAWSKLGLMLGVAVTAFFAYKICKYLTDDHHRSLWAAILTLSSAVCFVGVGIAGQNDIILILFGVLSVYALMRRKTFLFVLFAACSIAVKPFFIFAFIPLLLFVEKNVFRILYKCAGSVSIMLIGRILSSPMPMYKESIMKGPSVTVLKNLLGPGFDISQGKASYFLLALITLCFIAYVTKPVDENERKRFLLYIPAAVFLVMSCFSYTEFYRVVLIMPYVAILIMCNLSKMRLNLALSFVFQAFYCFALSFVYYSYNVSTVQNTVFSRIFPNAVGSIPRYINSKDFFSEHFSGIVPIFQSISASVILMAAVVLLVINYPRFHKQSDLEKKGVFAKYDHALLCINILTIVPFLGLLIMLYFA